LLLLVGIHPRAEPKQISKSKKSSRAGELKDYLSFAPYLRTNIEKAWSEYIPQPGDNTENASDQKSPHRYFLQLHSLSFRRDETLSLVAPH
jgi:hypothetical protein